MHISKIVIDTKPGQRLTHRASWLRSWNLSPASTRKGRARSLESVVRSRTLGFILSVLLPISMPGAGLSQTDGQVTLSGHVLNEVNNKPLRNVNVFIANSMLGAATDSAGYFVIKHVPLGSHELVVSRVGFKAKKIAVRLVSVKDREYEIRLVPEVIQLPDIEVVSSKRGGWKKDLKHFQELFIGTSRNASKCKMTNPEILEFVRDRASDRFSARASDILHVENRALGYRLFYLLEAFDLVDQTVRYLGTIRFEELDPKNEKELKKWRKNRLKTYRGSLRHFLATLAAGTTRSDGFQVSSMQELQEDLYTPDLEEVDLSRLTSSAELPFERQLHFFDYLQIIYTKEMEDREYIYWRINHSQSAIRMTTQKRVETSRPQAQASWIVMNKTSATIDTTGYLYDPLAVTVFGYWAWENVADLLPIEYSPPDTN